MKVVELGVYGLAISWDGKDRGGAAITSDLKESGGDEVAEFNAAMDAVESMVLAQFCAGVDVESPAYLEGVETAVQACGNNF